MDDDLYYSQSEELNSQRNASRDALLGLEHAKQEFSRSSREWHWSYEGGVKCLQSDGAKSIFETPGQQLEKIFESKAQDRAKSQAQLELAQRDYDEAVLANRTLGLGSAPSWVVKVLQVLRAYEVMQYFRVIGTHALYAYESAANVAFHSDQTATQDIDLLWYMQRRLKFVQHMESQKPPMSMVELLQKADPTFVRSEDELQSAINDEAYSVDFLRVENKPKERDAYTISGVEGDVMPVQAEGADAFMRGPIFEKLIVCVSTGEMCMMPTIDPVVFASFKQKMSVSDKREAQKRGRDGTQAAAVIRLLNAGLLETALRPEEVRALKVDGLNLGQ